MDPYEEDYDKETSMSLLRRIWEAPATDQMAVRTDDGLRKSDDNEMAEHNKAYTKILNSYKKNIDKSLTQKRRFKLIFFVLICLILITVTALPVVVIVLRVHNYFTDESIGVYITAIGTFLTGFFVLPKIVARYLFSPEEEKGMAEIVKSIQEYDTAIRKNRKN